VALLRMKLAYLTTGAAYEGAGMALAELTAFHASLDDPEICTTLS
jgi:hypothetical protein